MIFEWNPRRAKINMKKDEIKDELRSENDLSKPKGRVRVKYVERFERGTNLVLLEPDFAEFFHNSEEVNKALRKLIAEKV
jgi:hypothetical protein